jgi:hypothetical protein
MSSKTRIPFKNAQTANGLGLPGPAEVVVLFNSVTAFPGIGHLQDLGPVYWFTYAIAPSANATGNSVTAQYSSDRGVTWNEFYASSTNEPVGDATTFIDEIFIGQFRDVRVLFNNGTLGQATFVVNMSLDAKERTSAGI